MTTKEMASSTVAVAAAPARKFLLPLNQENVEVVGVTREPLPHLVERIVKDGVKELLDHV